jgi:hypothetical protein
MTTGAVVARFLERTAPIITLAQPWTLVDVASGTQLDWAASPNTGWTLTPDTNDSPYRYSKD